MTACYLCGVAILRQIERAPSNNRVKLAQKRLVQSLWVKLAGGMGCHRGLERCRSVCGQLLERPAAYP